jgi:hypothetical protein
MEDMTISNLQENNVESSKIRAASTPKYNKPHKFFKTSIDNDLDRLSTYLHKKYQEIESIPENEHAKKVFEESKSTSTIRWREYNVFQFNNEEIYNVFSAIKDLMLEACEYYEIDFKSQKYMVQGWFNINHKNVGKLDWHDHGGPWAPNFHGYYSIKAEPSSTWYKIGGYDGEPYEVTNVDNVVLLSEMGHPHAQGDWDWDGPRVTLAYDIVPLKMLRVSSAQEQHWIPLV